MLYHDDIRSYKNSDLFLPAARKLTNNLHSQFITRTVFRGNRVRQLIHANLDQLEDGKDVDERSLLTVSSDLQVQRLIPGVEAGKVSLEDIMDTTIRSEWKMVF